MTTIRIFYILAISALVVTIPYTNQIFEKKAPTINVLSWIGLLSTETIKAFEEETGVIVNLQYYSSSDELIMKTKSSLGKYDVTIASDYSIQQLIEEQYVKKLDKNQLSCNKYKEYLTNNFYDTDNLYSIPYLWEAYLFSKRKDFKKNLSWSDFFKSKDIKIALPSDHIENICMAQYYLKETNSDLSVVDILKDQKSFVDIFADCIQTSLIGTKACPIGIVRTSSIELLQKQNSNLDFVVPQNKIFLSIEHLLINNNNPLTYKFLNFLCREDIWHENVEYSQMFSARENENRLPNKELEILFPQIIKTKDNFLFFDSKMPIDEMIKIWITSHG